MYVCVFARDQGETNFTVYLCIWHTIESGCVKRGDPIKCSTCPAGAEKGNKNNKGESNKLYSDASWWWCTTERRWGQLKMGWMGERALGRHYHSTHIHKHTGHVTGSDVHVYVHWKKLSTKP